MPIHKTVIRNQGYRKNAIAGLEGHIERTRGVYTNPGIIRSRSGCNLHFKEPQNSYLGYIAEKLQDGSLSRHGLNKNSMLLDEFVLDVNSQYFEERGGYEFAKDFYTDAYRFALQEAGGEEWVVSAVMHADEIHKALSYESGKSIFHYHLHVAYIPVVEADIYYPANARDKALAGQFKERVMKISHSRKWPSYFFERPDGTRSRVSSYSSLQSRYYEAMRSCGYDGFIRGKRGSTLEHLETLEFKSLKERENLERLSGLVREKERQLGSLDMAIKQASERQAQAKDLLGRAQKTLSGKIALAPEDWEQAKSLLMEGTQAMGAAASLNEKLKVALEKNRLLASEYKDVLGKYIALEGEHSGYREALALEPQKIHQAISETLELAREREREAGRNLGQKSR